MYTLSTFQTIKDGAVALAANEEAGQAMPLGLAAEAEWP